MECSDGFLRGSDEDGCDVLMGEGFRDVEEIGIHI